MKAFYTDRFALPLPEGHRFPMEKYTRLRERVEGAGRCVLVEPDAASDTELSLAHRPSYIRKVVEGSLSRDEVRRMGFPWSPELVERSRRSVGGTIGAARAALAEGVSVNLAGGTHHAFPDRGSGFCVFNDVAVAVRVLQAARLIHRMGVVDLDVHQGDGTAAIFRDSPEVFTASVHGANNFPFRKEAGDLDIDLPDGASDDTYLDAVIRAVDAVLASSPELIFYVAGADAFESDRLGRLSVSKEGLSRRDALVFDAARAASVPVAMVMGGGYAETVDDTVDIHYLSVDTARESHARWSRR
ncbi:MAG: histone deacetylase [Gemmatimonadota bacterium]|nr:histone deacetylase [Gemmatimonadota bacterium]